MYFLGVIQGFATAFFFTPFQYFMKLLDANQNKSITHSTGLYTFSWSMGYALRPVHRRLSLANDELAELPCVQRRARR